MYQSTADLVNKAFRHKQGLLLVRDHGVKEPPVGEDFLMAMLDVFVENNVKNIFFELLPTELALLTSSPRGSQVFLLMSRMPRFRILLSFIELAQARGIAIRAVDQKVDHPLLYERLRIRDEYMAAQVKSLAKGEPYVMIAGLLHAFGLKQKLDVNVFALLPASTGKIEVAPMGGETIQNYCNQLMRVSVGDESRLSEQDRRVLENDKRAYAQTSQSIDAVVHWTLGLRKPLCERLSHHCSLAFAAVGALAAIGAGIYLSLNK